MSKKMKKVNLFEKVDITDSDYATKLYEKEEQKWKFKLTCTVIAVLGSIGSLLYANYMNSDNEFLSSTFAILWLCGMIAAVITSPINIFRVIFKFGSVAYYVVPFILIDLVAFVLGLALGFIAVTMLPVIPCLVTLYQSHQNMKYAKDYLALHNNETAINNN